MLLVIFLVAITGCFHEDALADTFDGFGGGWNRDQILTILKDSRIGSYGAAALALSLVARVTLLASLPASEMARTLIAAHVLCRWTTLPLSYFLAPARTEPSQGARLAKLTSRGSLAIGTALALAIAIAALGVHAIAPHSACNPDHLRERLVLQPPHPGRHRRLLRLHQPALRTTRVSRRRVDARSRLPMIELLLIRHPETDLAGTFCGHSDPPINAAGQAQLEALVDALKAEEIEAIYTSDLQRARTLACAIAEAHGIPCYTQPALRELCFGDWEALTWAEIERQSPEQAADWLARYPYQPAPNGETFCAFQARVLHHFDRILASPHRRVAIVTHAGVVRTLLIARLGVDEPTAWALAKPHCTPLRYTPRTVTE